jgi:tRNA(fMet)-specific endonuclease VapC
MFYLDTNTCIYFIKGSYISLIDEFRKRKPEEIRIPSIVKAELLLGAEKSRERKKTLKICNTFLEPFGVVSFDDDAAVTYAGLRAALEKKGRIIGPNDLIIAATVMAHNGTLVTHNTKEFKRVTGLLLDDWVKE